jgi:Novel STAND NTPase 1
MTATDRDQPRLTTWDNPYVGPRAFRPGERLPARDQEIYDLTDLLIAERVVLLHAPSGAGKTSLLQAGVAPMLKQKQLLRQKPFRPTRLLRVKTPPPPRGVRNRYVYSVALDLLPHRDPHELDNMTLPQLVKEVTEPMRNEIPILMFDQFEEILILDPTDRKHQEIFFSELGAVLANRHVWALFAMREDYMGGLDRYLTYLPGHLSTTYLLDFLDIEAAKISIQQPSADLNVEFTDEAADELLRRLKTVKVQSPTDGVEEVEAPYVQPFQLQVVCRNLWKILAKKRRGRFETIDLRDIEHHLDIGQALRQYYGDAVKEVAGGPTAELAIRDWFETQLITDQRRRNQTVTGPATGSADPAAVALALQDAYLIRSDTRAGSIWYELAHDQLITPVLEDNRDWRESRLEPWQRDARDWQATHQRELLLAGPELRNAQRHAEALGTVTAQEREFLDESTHADRERSILERTRHAMNFFAVLALLELVVILVLVVLLFWRG